MELYVHVPFCIKKCKYCDFLSFEIKSCDKEKYLESLIKDIEFEGKKNSLPLKSIFIGGGTPGLLNESEIELIIDSINNNFILEDNCEFTIEVNPCTVSLSLAKKYLELGINRVSMGIQSFDDEELNLLGRVHDSKVAINAFNLLREAGFKNINIDLINGLPNQSVDKAMESLKMAIKLNPEHISTYELIVEPQTPFYELYGPDSGFSFDTDVLADIYIATIDILKRNGYYQEEVSNFSRPGFECKHNLGYWSLEDYIGVGLGATGCVNNIRYRKEDSFDRYFENPTSSIKEELSVNDRKNEFIYLGLRRKSGISLSEYEKRFHECFPIEKQNILLKYIDEYIEKSDDTYFFTDKGFLVSNIILAELID